MSFARIALENGGSIYPLLVDSSHTKGTGLTNPSIFTDGDRILINLRHVEYTLYHSEKKKFSHPWGPIQYLHAENDMHLRTNNFLGELNEDLTIKYCTKVDTTELDKNPLWDFVGLEDARIVRWEGKLYLSGVRRDTTPNGQGRMELSEISQEGESFKEISRLRIPAPFDDGSYCEKNWMPVLDMPYHYVKWCNPTEVVKVDPEKGTCERVFLGEHVPQNYDFRGGSQVIPWGDYRICVVHQVDLYHSKSERRDARYRHRFIVWDKDWNVVKYCEPFDFLGGEVEFAVGATFYKNDLLITFGFQDNSSFLLRVPQKVIEDHIGISVESEKMEKRGKGNLEDFPRVYSVSLEECEDRRNILLDQFSNYGINDVNILVSKRFADTDDADIIDGEYLSGVCNGSKGCFLSHMRSIKDWYENTDEEYAFFCEDDLSLETVQYWNFTWKEFIESLPKDWECVQLQVTSDTYRFTKNDMKLQHRKWNFWGITAYIIKRSYAKKLVEAFCKGDRFLLETQTDEPITDPNYQMDPLLHKLPYVEHLFYLGFGKVYTIPLFVENVNFFSTYTLNGEPHVKGGHTESYYEIANWWKYHGKETELKSMMKDPSKKYNIVDYFPYFNKTGKELLELRINILKDYVDEFVICESNKTQSGIPIEYELENTIKELGLEKENIKIIKLNIPDDEELEVQEIDKINCYEGNSSNMKSVQSRTRERMQKDALLSVLEDYDESTIFIVSDSDEIIDPAKLGYYLDNVYQNQQCLIKVPLVHLEGRADLRVYDKNTGNPKMWDGGMFICTKSHLSNATPSQMRSNVFNPYPIVYIYDGGRRLEDVGWHFSWMGDSSIRKAKREAFTHYNDTFGFLNGKSYDSSEVISMIDNCLVEEGEISPSGDINTILRKYSLNNLPKEIFTSNGVKNYLLPTLNLDKIKTFDWGKFPKECSNAISSEIFDHRIYERFFEVEEGDIVVDIGSSVGPFTVSILDKNPKKVYCVEPSKSLFEALVNNTSNYQNVTCINKAVCNPNTYDIRIFCEGNPDIYGGVTRESYDPISFNQFIKENSIEYIDFLKMDCESSEYEIFVDESIDFLVNNVRKISAELHVGNINDPRYEDTKKRFRYFRDNYLTRFNNYRVLGTDYSDLTSKIFDEEFMNSFQGEFLLYILNDIDKSRFISNNIFEDEYQKACNTPSDINENLHILYELSKECSHVTEMGVRTGVSTRAFLNTDVVLRSYDLYIEPTVNELFKTAKEFGKNVDYIEADVTEIEIDNTDLLFIDTWHCYDQLKLELDLHSKKVNKYIVFHDTHSYGVEGESYSGLEAQKIKGIKDDKKGLLPAIIDFMIENPQWKFKICKTNNNGLIVIER